MSERSSLLAGIELGGTKVIVAVGRDREIIQRASVATADATSTMAAVVEALTSMNQTHQIAALGVASFGPLGVNPAQSDFGTMLPTPKAGWTGAAILAPLAAAIAVPTVMHTDVTAAALAEMRWGAATRCSDVIYVTLGTGVGMGIIANGEPVMGTLHPEAGHIRVRRLAGDTFAGTCPFHGDCLEGLASGPAVAARAGVVASELTPDSQHWLAVADALAEAFATLILTLAGTDYHRRWLGVGQPHLLPLVRNAVRGKLAGYHPRVTAETIDTLIVSAMLGGDAGPLGALCLAEMALAQCPA